MTSEQFELIIFLVVFSVIANWAAWQNNFFTLPGIKTSVQIRPSQVFWVFFLYLAGLYSCNYVLSFLTRGLVVAYQEKLIIASINQLISTFLGLFFVGQFLKKKPIPQFRSILKNKTPSSKSVLYDFFIGVATWMLSFPVAAIVGEISDLVLSNLFHLPSHEQAAVLYLKAMLSSTTLLVIALFTILVVAPLVEEFLFRGILQNFFKRHLGTKAAILLSSFCFALFHYSQSQGASNISLILSLFTFACFLGFIYEKQQSLIASIGLHIMFNLFSSLRILLNT